MKKVWIESILTCIILMLPITNVVSANEVDEDCGCQPMNRVDLLRIKLLMIKLEVFTNIFLSRFGHIPEVEGKCKEISNKVTTLREMINELNPDLPWGDNPIICTILSLIIIPLITVGGFFFICYTNYLKECQYYRLYRK